MATQDTPDVAVGRAFHVLDHLLRLMGEDDRERGVTVAQFYAATLITRGHVVGEAAVDAVLLRFLDILDLLTPDRDAQGRIRELQQDVLSRRAAACLDLFRDFVEGEGLLGLDEP